jgi:SPP1 gp7 family putative phage head morphogenesis protein
LSIQNRVNALNITSMSELTPRQISTLLRLLEADAFGIENSQRGKLVAALRDLAGVQQRFGKDLLGLGGRVAPSAAMAEAEDRPLGYGETLAAVLAAWVVAHNKRVSSTIRKATIEGSSPSAVLSGIRGTRKNKFEDGLMAQTQRGVETTVNTATQHVVVTTLAETFSEETKYYRWVSVLDNRTSVICRSLAGQVFEFGKGPLPPQHPNCRSSIMPISGRGGPPVSQPTYYEWLSRQPQSVQDRVLGKTRGKLFRDGKISNAEFSALQLDKNFKPVTLDELRKEVPSAFRSAGLED